MFFTQYSGVMLTYKDLQEIGKLIDEKLKEAFKHLPTKEDFYTRMDALSKEIKTSRRMVVS